MKEDENKIYRLALSLYKKEIDKGEFPGLCIFIGRSSTRLGLYNYRLLDLSFYKNRPNKKLGAFVYWWDERDTKSRIDYMEKLIKETE